MESEDYTKVVDGIYKNIVEKFNPGARQLISAGKTYLKTLQAASIAAKSYLEAITKLALQAQVGALGGSTDIGSALTQMVNVYQEIQAQQNNILKAFYVDLLAPFDTNLEKDTKVIQSEQKKFLQQHKQRVESYTRAANNVKKIRKKNRTSKTGTTLEKEMKHMQILEEERNGLETFCEQSLSNAITQERRRYGFILERQCSMAKHYLAFHSKGNTLFQRSLEDWLDVAKSREIIPENISSRIAAKLRGDEDIYEIPHLDDDDCLTSKLRKTKSMDASCLDVRTIGEISSSPQVGILSRAKSDFNLAASTHSLAQVHETPTRPKSMAVPNMAAVGRRYLARSLYAYLSSGDNQLSFLEGDLIALVGDRNKGWQYGENMRTQRSGWFPCAYTELIPDEDDEIAETSDRGLLSAFDFSTPTSPPAGYLSSFGSTPPAGSNKIARPLTMFGDTLPRGSNRDRDTPSTSSELSATPPPPPPLPAPSDIPPTIPTNGISNNKDHRSSPQHISMMRRSLTSPLLPPSMTSAKRPTGNISLHSSNDSGFSNDGINPPPQPEVDYSDSEENPRTNSSDSSVITSKPRRCPSKPSSVRDWLYKSPLLFPANQQQSSTMSLSRRGNPAGFYPNGHRRLSSSQSIDHLVTMTRNGNGKTVTIDEDKICNGMEGNSKQYINRKKKQEGVKRSKSVLKFNRGKDDTIIQPMWEHDSEIEVMEPVPLKSDKGTSTVYIPLPPPPDIPPPRVPSKNKKRASPGRSASSRPPQHFNNSSIRFRRAASENDLRDHADNESIIVVDDHTKQPCSLFESESHHAIIRRHNSKHPSNMNTKDSEMHYQHYHYYTNEDYGLFNYGRKLERRLYHAEGASRMDQKSETTGNMCGPWYDLWGVDESVTCT